MGQVKHGINQALCTLGVYTIHQRPSINSVLFFVFFFNIKIKQMLALNWHPIVHCLILGYKLNS